MDVGIEQTGAEVTPWQSTIVRSLGRFSGNGDDEEKMDWILPWWATRDEFFRIIPSWTSTILALVNR